MFTYVYHLPTGAGFRNHPQYWPFFWIPHLHVDEIHMFDGQIYICLLMKSSVVRSCNGLFRTQLLVYDKSTYWILVTVYKSTLLIMLEFRFPCFYNATICINYTYTSAMFHGYISYISATIVMVISLFLMVEALFFHGLHRRFTVSPISSAPRLGLHTSDRRGACPRSRWAWMTKGSTWDSDITII